MKKRIKLISFLMSVAILTCGMAPRVISANTDILSEVFNNGLTSSTDNIAEESDTGLTVYETDIIVKEEIISGEVIGNVVELEELREENVKHFRLSNGTYEAIVYGSAIHRKDGNGVWQDINNDLRLNTVELKQIYSTMDGRVSFANEFSYNIDIMTLSENGYNISVRLIKDTSGTGLLDTEDSNITDKIIPTITNSNSSRPNSFDTIDEAARINNTSSLKYSNIRTNTSIEYILQGNNIKENIILSGKSDSYIYGFELRLSGLIAEMTEHGSITIKDSKTEEEKYFIPMPYMYDSAGNYSYDVAYQLQEISSGRYIFAINASGDWIEADGRAFPVTIDPIVTCSSTTSDTYSYSSYPDTNYGSSEQLWLSNARKTYIKINLPELPIDSIISEAYLFMPYYYNITTGSLTASAHQIVSSWTENNLTHNNAPTTFLDVLSTDLISASSSITSSSPGYASFLITDLFCDWYDGTQPNYGIVIKRVSGDNNSVIFKSSESSGNDHPYLRVNYSYVIPDGVYSLENMGYSNQYLTVQSGSYNSGKYVQHIYSEDTPSDSDIFDRTCLFKISQKGNTGRYIIRYMTNNNLSIGISGTSFVTKLIPCDDADVQDADTFYIEWMENGFHLRPYGSTLVLRINGASEANIGTANKESASADTIWRLSQYTGEHKCGFVFSTSEQWLSIGMIQGKNTTARAKFWYTKINSEPILVLREGYEDMGILTWNKDTGVMSFLPQNIGSVTIRMVINHLDGTKTGLGGHYSRIVPQEGIYYIQNIDTERYVQVPSKQEGEKIQQWEYLDKNSEKFIVEHVANSHGYIRIKSAHSNLYLGIDSSNTSRVTQYSNKNDYTLWKIDRSSSGTLIFKCKATESSGMVLSVPLNLNYNGTDLTHISYTDDTNYRDEWIFIFVQSLTNTIYLDLSYDTGFLTLHPNASAFITQQALVVQQKFYEEFGVTVILGAPYLFSSYADTSCHATPDMQCDHADENSCINSTLRSNGTVVAQTYHHKNISNIVARIPFPDNLTTLKAVYTGHKCCRIINTGEDSNQHAGMPNGIAYTAIGITMLFNTSSTLSNARVLLHEFGHFYGAPDHYNVNCPSTEEIQLQTGNYGFNRECIYGEDRNTDNVLSNLTICDGCRAEIESYLWKYNYENGGN